MSRVNSCESLGVPGSSRVDVLDHPLNHKHGRAAQLALWGLVPGALPSTGLLVVEDNAVALKDRLAAYHQRCARYGPLPEPQIVNVDHGRKRFLLYRLDAPRPAQCVLPALAWIDLPTPGAGVSGVFELFGWAFKDGAGIARVEVTLDGAVVAEADYGQSMPHVAAYWRISTDPAHPNVGFHARIDTGSLGAGRHWLGLVLHGRDGSVEPWVEQQIRIE